MGQIIQWPRHKLYRCPPGLARCAEGRCHFCEGGLSVCITCGAAEGELATECPGIKLHEDQLVAVLNGHIDYRQGQWVCISEEAKAPLA